MREREKESFVLGSLPDALLCSSSAASTVSQPNCEEASAVLSLVSRSLAVNETTSQHKSACANTA